MQHLSEFQRMASQSIGELEDGSVAILTVSERARRLGEAVVLLVSNLSKFEIAVPLDKGEKAASDSSDDRPEKPEKIKREKSGEKSGDKLADKSGDRQDTSPRDGVQNSILFLVRF